MNETRVVCLNCHRALKYGELVEAYKCLGCPMDDGAAVEEPWLTPEEEIDYAALYADEDADDYTPSQSSAPTEPIRPPRQVWPGRQVRKAKGRRNGS